MVKIECNNPEEVVKEMFWLAYQSCGAPFGMGQLQAVGRATKEMVWNNVLCAGDYEFGHMTNPNKLGEANGDYVFGRMMKLYVRWDKSSVEVADSKPRADYQSWCGKYPTYESLAVNAIDNLEKQQVGT